MKNSLLNKFNLLSNCFVPARSHLRFRSFRKGKNFVWRDGEQIDEVIFLEKPEEKILCQFDLLEAIFEEVVAECKKREVCEVDESDDVLRMARIEIEQARENLEKFGRFDFKSTRRTNHFFKNATFAINLLIRRIARQNKSGDEFAAQKTIQISQIEAEIGKANTEIRQLMSLPVIVDPARREVDQVWKKAA